MIKVSDLKVKDIINIVDGKRLGYIKDIELNLAAGRIHSLILPGTTKFMGIFGRCDDVAIAWNQIKKVGADVILVEVQSFSELRNQEPPEDLDAPY
ncbi:YlmC/YmxH family sporulation protein [Dehalobacterium formicoaceticum]|uniref:YlmC/YmxH family sporulation protein n=1 Tax=Dehalobacterium formicoaceticum TaxID=51515 RepID=A0ABT1Y0X4_9FIRM|nr:YlmC/YmxH family sporulation protein [Dehalobacterium formicoaceticum]MCR6544507.1 YlmC/YmxH family sporulation protein [Dehalobacterium formicoaceticum]